jgi:hypothetical protein
MKPGESIFEQEMTSVLMPSFWDYRLLDRREFISDHEGFFRLCIEGMKPMRPRDAEILSQRWFEGRTLLQIGMRYDISRERVRGIEMKAFRIIFRAIQFLWEGL